MLGIYLYLRALHAVSLGTDFSNRHAQQQQENRMMGHNGHGHVGMHGRMSSGQRKNWLKNKVRENKHAHLKGGVVGGGGGHDGTEMEDEEEANAHAELYGENALDTNSENGDLDPTVEDSQSEDGGAAAADSHDNPEIDSVNDKVKDETNYKTPWHGKAPPTPPWWMESDPDDSFERIFLPSEEKKKYKHLRNLDKGGHVNKGIGLKHFFNPMCRHYRFDETVFPTVSVIMTTQNEPDDWISLSVESILARTPPALLVEVIVVDDNGTPGHHGLPKNIRKGVDEDEWTYLESLSPKVKVIHHDDREGCARSRLSGARVATGEVLMFVDSHIEMLSSTWYHHLAIPIIENPRTIAMQTIDVVDDLGSKDYSAGVGPLQYGIVSTEFWFGYQADRFGDYSEPIDATQFTEEELIERKKMKYQAERPHDREPYETPFGPGSLFAIRADEFWRLGGYDEGLFVWGGENTEMAFKMWMCGGRMLMVPCSRVGHMYRQHKEKDGRGALTRWPPTLPQEMTDRLGCAYKNSTYTGKFVVLKHPADNFTRITTRNNMRIMETWVGDHPAKSAYYKRLFGQEKPKPEFQRFIDDWEKDPAALKQVRIKKENKCHDFEWWDKYVYMRLTGRHHPWHLDNKKYQKVSCGSHKAKSCELCPQGNGKDWCNGDCKWCDKLEKCLPEEDSSKLCKAKGLQISDKVKEAAHERTKTKAKEGRHLEKRKRATLAENVIEDDNKLTLSIVLPCGFEHDFFIRTAESLFYETPAEILKEIVIVDDASDPPLKDSWSEEAAAKFGVKYVRVDSPLGLIGAKDVGARAATGDVIVFFDCHVKPAENYWVPYVKEIHENYKRVVIPTITNLNVDTWEEFGRPSGSAGGMSKCYLTFDAEFKWTTDDTPYVPIMSGGLLAISRKWFFETGGYDSTMKGWGGENLDQSLRIWRCGGEIVTAPESYVAHMWRDGTEKTKAKYKVGAGDAIKNRARAMKAHLGDWYEKTLTFPSFKEWRGKDLDTSSITDGFSDLHCEDFEWYLNRFKNIYRDAGVAPREVFQIEAVTSDGSIEESEKLNLHKSSALCLELKKSTWTNYGSGDEVVLKECTGATVRGATASEPKPIWWHGSNRRKDGSCCGGLRAWNTDQCIDGRNPQHGAAKLASHTCDLDLGLEAFLQPSDDDKEEFSLELGGTGHHCVSVVGGSSLGIVACADASKWRKRYAFTPMEYELLSSDYKNDWARAYL